MLCRSASSRSATADPSGGHSLDSSAAPPSECPVCSLPLTSVLPRATRAGYSLGSRCRLRCRPGYRPDLGPGPDHEPRLAAAGAELEKENAFFRVALKSCLTRRRGSAPCNLVVGDTPLLCPAPAQLRQQACLAQATSRRGSLPSELLQNSLPKQVRTRVLTSSAAGGGKRPSLLRRRSMGTELLSLAGNQSIKERQLVQKYLNRPF